MSIRVRHTDLAAYSAALLRSVGLTAANAGANFTKVQNLQFAAATGEFGGGGQAFDPLFRDPTLASDTATVSYSYAPTDHGPDNQPAAVTSDSGSPLSCVESSSTPPATATPRATLICWVTAAMDVAWLASASLMSA